MVGSPNTGGGRGNMDDLADCFAGAFTVTNTPNDTNRPHPRFAQYKMKTSGMNQVRKYILTLFHLYNYLVCRR